jgi:hypothetical protein
MQTEPNSFERFILHNRIYCEHEGCKFRLTPAVQVLSLYKKPVAVCEEHADLGEKEAQPEAIIQGRMAVQEQNNAPLPSPWTDEEFAEFANQEPLPPNQGFQLPAEEQPITKEQEIIYAN